MVAVSEIAEPVLILAASDGAGSAKESATGSHLACSRFITLSLEHLSQGKAVAAIDRELMTSWLGEIVTTLARESYTAGIDLREYACTLLTAVVAKDCASFAQIGDGAIVVLEEEIYRPVCWPQTGEYANTTHFITQEEAATHLQMVQIPQPVDEIALFTDGLQSLALRYATREAHAPFFRPFFIRLRGEPPGESPPLNEGLMRWLDSAAVNQRTDDDKTLVLATRKAAILEQVVATTATGGPAPAENL